MRTIGDILRTFLRLAFMRGVAVWGAILLTACNDDDLHVLTPGQEALLGREVNIQATVVDPFREASRATYDDTGVFNEDDLMRIYREYADGTNWVEQAYRTYLHNTEYATGTSISLGTDWRVVKGRKKKDPDTEPVIQTDADSMTWENGRTVRFRAWTRSNYANALTNCYKETGEFGLSNYYPDFCLSDWVTVSGPTEHLPLDMHHACSRIVIRHLVDGNSFHHVEVSTDWEDYKWADNADTNENDETNTEHGKTDEQAKAECAEVVAAYNRMCMPAGIDVENGELYAMMHNYWCNMADDDAGKRKIRYLEEEAPSAFYHYNTQAPDYIATNVQRPLFTNVHNGCYLLTIPYDMSTAETRGDILTLPACTRFRIYMRDVNNGDSYHTGGYEGKYHIFSLQDIKDKTKPEVNGEYPPKYPNGLTFLPGYSYRFNVGYRYDRLTITASDHLSWEEQMREEDELADAAVAVPTTSPKDYTWWKNTIKNSIPQDGGDYDPVFHITSEKEFIEFINLVNGTAPILTEGLNRAKRNVVNSEHENNAYDKYNWWYSTVSANKRDTTWVSSAEATEMGYLLYESYHAANANQPAFSQEEYLRANFPFYDMSRDRHYTVYLDCDLDLADWNLPSIGILPSDDDSTGKPFMGFFDGQMHTIRNANMEDEYLFNYIESAAIRNLKLESTHPLALLQKGTNTCYIVGIDLRANCTDTCPIAGSLTSNRYNNPSYVVGCIHVGDATHALVGESSNLYMYGCMHAAEGIASNTGALLGGYLPYSSESNWKFFTPQISFNYNDMTSQLKGKPTWGRFMCNYYDTELSKGTNAVADIADRYSPLEYIRGRDSFVLKAKNDNRLRGNVTFNTLQSVSQRMAYYGLAPWRAMNYGIYRYNDTGVGKTHTCNAHYVNNSTGYVHRYPDLIANPPTTEQYANPLEQEN